MNLEVRPAIDPARGVDTPSAPCTPAWLLRQRVTLRESQLQCIRKLHEAEGLQQMRGRLQDMSHILGSLVDAGADDRKTRFVALQPQGRIERLRIGRLDQDDVRVDSGRAVEELRLVPQPSDDRRIEAPDVFVRFDDQEKCHEHVLVDHRMFSRAGQV